MEEVWVEKQEGRGGGVMMKFDIESEPFKLLVQLVCLVTR